MDGITVADLRAFLAKFDDDAKVSESSMVFVVPPHADEGHWWELSFPMAAAVARTWERSFPRQGDLAPTVSRYNEGRRMCSWPLSTFVPKHRTKRYEVTVWLDSDSKLDAGQLVVDAFAGMRDEHNVSVGTVHRWKASGR